MERVIKLSKREQQCLFFASCDLSTRETAEKLHLSYDTIKSHRRFVMRKLSCRSMAGAISRAIEMKLINHSEKEIVQAISEARRLHLPISILAVQHSQGGQTLAKNGIALNMLNYNKVISLDVPKKQITVESGITWDALQHYINPYNLSVKVMQDSYIFSVGGSLSANAHGEDFRSSPIDNTVVGFHLILVNGKKIWVSPTENTELWQTVLGGYGALGVISDVTLQLTNNNLLQGHDYETDIDHLASYFQKKILPDSNTVFFYARLQIAPGKGFLRKIYVITSSDTHALPAKIIKLKDPESTDFLIRPLFNFSRNYKIGKTIRWSLEERIIKYKYGRSILTRNEIMRKAIRFATDHQEAGHADWLQEYFIPADQLKNFIDVLRSVAVKNNINLLNANIRYIPKDTNFLLSYAKTNCFSVVLYFDQPLSPSALKQAKSWTQQRINAAIKNGGSYYLTYQGFATKLQFETTYPNYNKWKQIKEKNDPEGLFSNQFYQRYF